MNPSNSEPQESDFAQSTHDFHYRTWMRLGRPKPFDEWLEDRKRDADVEVKGKGVVDWLLEDRPETYTYDPKELNES